MPENKLPLHFNLRLLREYHNLSQEGFAQLFGLSRGQVNNYERHQTPPLPTLLKICRHFKLNVEVMASIDLGQLGLAVASKLNEGSLEAYLSTQMEPFNEALQNGANSETLVQLHQQLLSSQWLLCHGPQALAGLQASGNKPPAGLPPGPDHVPANTQTTTTPPKP